MTKASVTRKSLKLCGMCGYEKEDPAIPICSNCLLALSEQLRKSTGKPVSVEEAVNCFENAYGVNYAEEQQNTAYMTAVYSALLIAVIAIVRYVVWGTTGPVFMFLIGLCASFLIFGIVMYKTENIHLSSLAFSVCLGITLAVI